MSQKLAEINDNYRSLEVSLAEMSDNDTPLKVSHKTGYANLQQQVHAVEMKLSDLQEQFGSFKGLEIQTLNNSIEKLQKQLDKLQNNNERRVSNIQKYSEYTLNAKRCS